MTNIWDSTGTVLARSQDHRASQGRWTRGELFLAEVRAFVPEGGTILDYGCGPGRLSALLAYHGYRVLGVDPSPGMIALAKQQPLDGLDIEFNVIATDQLRGVPRREFDAIVCSSVIEYVEQPELLLAWFRDGLGSSGVLVISFANSKSIWRKFLRLLGPPTWQAVQKHVWCSAAFQQLLRAGGFEVLQPPQYFESVCDATAITQPLSRLRVLGMLGLVVACKSPGMYAPSKSYARTIP